MLRRETEVSTLRNLFLTSCGGSHGSQGEHRQVRSQSKPWQTFMGQVKEGYCAKETKRKV